LKISKSSSGAHVWAPGAKATVPIAKSLVILKSNFFGSEKVQVLARFCRNKKFCSVKSRFPVHLPLYKFWTIFYFLGENFQVIIFSCPSTDVPSFVEKYPKIKYTIFDRPPYYGKGPL
jgi:hypothetical protein